MLLNGRTAVTHRVWQTLVAFACFLAVEVLCVIPNAQAGVVHSVTPDSEYTGYAELFPYVGYMKAENAAGEFAFRQSLTLIDPHYAILSGHGLLENESDLGSLYSNITVGFGSNFNIDSGNLYTPANVIFHPNYSAIGARDMALLYFRDAITDVPHANLYRGDPAATVGLDATMVGFGLTGTVADGVTGSDGNKRAGYNITDSFDGEFLRARFYRPGHSKFRELGILGAPGDSGGFWGSDIDGEILLTGIVNNASGTPFGTATYLDRTEAIPLDIHWIDSVTAVPEPRSAMFLLLELSACLCRRRRRAPS